MFQLNVDGLLETNIIKVTSSSPVKWSFTNRKFVTVVPLLANKISHYYSFKMKIKNQYMCQICLLVIKTEVCDSFICLERVHIL